MTVTGERLDACLYELFEEQVRRTPWALAVVEPGTSLTHEELDRRSELLGGHLRRLGVGPHEVVGILWRPDHVSINEILVQSRDEPV